MNRTYGLKTRRKADYIWVLAFAFIVFIILVIVAWLDSYGYRDSAGLLIQKPVCVWVDRSEIAGFERTSSSLTRDVTLIDLADGRTLEVYKVLNPIRVQGFYVVESSPNPGPSVHADGPFERCPLAK